MENLEVSAKTVEEAIQHALGQLGVSREKVEVTVLSEGKTGILGLGAEEARIIVRPVVPMPVIETEVAETAKNILEKLLTTMNITASVTLCENPFATEGEDTNFLAFNIKGDDLGILIGRSGQTLSCLQYILRLIVSNQIKSWVPIIIDVEEYKQHRYKALQALANRMAEQVETKKVPFSLEPMPAYERRIIHITLADHPNVSTQSVGEGERRKVVIVPKE